LWHGRRRILWLAVTAHPTTEWLAQQLTEACGCERTPSYIVRDRDRVYGEVFQPAASRHRQSGPANCATLPMHEWACGTADWLAPAGVALPRDRVWRAAPAPRAPFVHGLLQQSEDTPIPEQGCPRIAGGSGRWRYPRGPNPRRITSSLCSDLIYDRDKGRQVARHPAAARRRPGALRLTAAERLPLTGI